MVLLRDVPYRMPIRQRWPWVTRWDGTWPDPHHTMNETDLPCSDCGTELIERTVHVEDLPISTDWRGFVRIAHCPSCDVRYYPEHALSRVANQTTDFDLQEENR